jgi:hypothetical protein
MLVTSSLVLGAMLAIGSCHAYLTSWLISSKLNPHGRTSPGEIKNLVLSMILPFGLVVGSVGALGVVLKQVLII